MSPHTPLSDAAVARLRAYAELRLTADEVQAWLSVPISEEEREDALSLIRWFRRRYPEPAQRRPTCAGRTRDGSDEIRLTSS